jgi:hypothetical protein
MSSMASLQSVTDTEAGSLSLGEFEPGPTSADRSERIREIAYYLWLEEGCPDDGAERHWSSAEALLDSDPEQRKNIEGEPPGEPVTDAPTEPVTRRSRRGAAE